MQEKARIKSQHHSRQQRENIEQDERQPRKLVKQQREEIVGEIEDQKQIQQIYKSDRDALKEIEGKLEASQQFLSKLWEEAKNLAKQADESKIKIFFEKMKNLQVLPAQQIQNCEDIFDIASSLLREMNEIFKGQKLLKKTQFEMSPQEFFKKNTMLLKFTKLLKTTYEQFISYHDNSDECLLKQLEQMHQRTVAKIEELMTVDEDQYSKEWKKILQQENQKYLEEYKNKIRVFIKNGFFIDMKDEDNVKLMGNLFAQFHLLRMNEFLTDLQKRTKLKQQLQLTDKKTMKNSCDLFPTAIRSPYPFFHKKEYKQAAEQVIQKIVESKKLRQLIFRYLQDYTKQQSERYEKNWQQKSQKMISKENKNEQAQALEQEYKKLYREAITSITEDKIHAQMKKLVKNIKYFASDYKQLQRYSVLTDNSSVLYINVKPLYQKFKVQQRDISLDVQLFQSYIFYQILCQLVFCLKKRLDLIPKTEIKCIRNIEQQEQSMLYFENYVFCRQFEEAYKGDFKMFVMKDQEEGGDLLRYFYQRENKKSSGRIYGPSIRLHQRSEFNNKKPKIYCFKMRRGPCMPHHFKLWSKQQ